MSLLAVDKWTDEADEELTDQFAAVGKARARLGDRLRQVVGSDELDLTAPTILG